MQSLGWGSIPAGSAAGADKGGDVEGSSGATVEAASSGTTDDAAAAGSTAAAGAAAAAPEDMRSAEAEAKSLSSGGADAGHMLRALHGLKRVARSSRCAVMVSVPAGKSFQAFFDPRLLQRYTVAWPHEQHDDSRRRMIGLTCGTMSNAHSCCVSRLGVQLCRQRLTFVQDAWIGRPLWRCSMWRTWSWPSRAAVNYQCRFCRVLGAAGCRSASARGGRGGGAGGHGT